MPFMRYSNDMFHYMFKAEFVTLISSKVPSGKQYKFVHVRINGAWNCQKVKENSINTPKSPLAFSLKSNGTPYKKCRNAAL